MSYPWYSTGSIKAGPNRQAAIYTDKNCNTKELRYRFEWIVLTGNGKKSVSDTDLNRLQEKAQAAVAKYPPRNVEAVRSDMAHLFDRS